MNKKLITLAVQAAIAGSALLSILPTFAQEIDQVEKQIVSSKNTPEKKVKEIDEKITVTGSRLRRDNFNVSTPLVTLDKDDIEDSGLGELTEILVDGIPSLSFSTSNTSSQSSASSTGITTVQLRNLGSNRTLTLIDGRRVVSNSKSGNAVSLSTIPAGMVARTEVITGGNSATYGADAVAGVVNIITQTDKEGFSFKARGGESTDGEAREFTLDVNYGTSFANNKGYLYFSTNWDRQFGLRQEDRSRASIEADNGYDNDLMCNTISTAEGDVCLRDTTQDQWRSRSDGTFGGVFLESSNFDTQYWYDGTTLKDDWKGNEELYGIDSDQFVMLKVPSDRFSTALKVDFDLTDDVMFYSQIQVSGNFTDNLKTPEDSYEGEEATFTDRVTGEPGVVEAGYIPINNPYVPDVIRETASQYKDRIYWDRRFAEVGPVITENERITVRTWAGLQGTMFDNSWDWDVSVNYGRYRQDQLRKNEIDVFNLINALDAGYAEDGITIQCNDADARATGCVPINLFGEGSVTAEAANYIRANARLKTINELITFSGYMTGDLFELPAGSVPVVFGFEYRIDKQEAKTSDEFTYGGITANLIPSFKGQIKVAELFGEASFPLIRDASFAKHVSIETSGRVSQYDLNNIDIVGSYKLGFLWQVVDGLNIRGNWAIAQRAPSVGDIFEPLAGDFDSFDDLCDEVTATSTDLGHDNCRLIPEIAAEINTDPSFEFESEGNNYSPGAGNPDLEEEKGKTTTLGFTYQPAYLEGFQIAIDYFDITIDDAISAFSNERILEECYATDIVLGDENEFCDVITRNSEGQLTQVIQRSYNIDEVSTRGIDYALAYRHDLNNYGRLKFKMDWTHLLEYSNTSTGNEGKIKTDLVGFDDIFENSASASLTWSYEDLRISWRTKYLSSITDDRELQIEWEEDIVDNAERCSNGDEDCIANPESLAFQHFPSYFRHDISASYEVGMDNDMEVKFSGGIKNIFNDNGDFYVTSRGNYKSEYGGGVGRFFHLAVEVTF
ncbi:TonB-dependent receptor plug domain-containing protein [Paraglaciecola arctica]|uniref:Phosphatidylglycerophosphatase n=1 Tax=Paraglaciecola arctica BSs20135 TaxID=493475 RepID=K6YHW7_9ALTE|nr:TonB-dependent receptor [Paraglaciecola arctica]GAC17767.1 phosphatidylglycerophosphatase [Paraglaciecola arctica BSs20135]